MRVVQLVRMLAAGALLATGVLHAAPNAAPVRAAGITTTIIDWVPFVRFGGITYLQAPTAGRPLGAADLGQRFSIVRFKVAGVVHDPAYHIKDGDAAFLPIGTPVYRVKNYAPTFRLAARVGARIVLFEADTDPLAHSGGDLLDIGGKVRAIGINSAKDGTTRLATITDPRIVARLVGVVLHGPVDQARTESTSAKYFITFLLRDGTVITRAYWLASGQLARGIMTPPAFRAAVDRALKR
ncbi:MAG: hypothetical protein JWO42_243 [Chloroflexi bacterium]|jgi:hypothetical protein|nr:hypothetical protein [Chloroflexota bacterium]